MTPDDLNTVGLFCNSLGPLVLPSDIHVAATRTEIAVGRLKKG